MEHVRYVQVLRVRQDTDVSSSSVSAPVVQYFVNKFKNTFCPSVSDEEIAGPQALWISHQRPADIPCGVCHWFDVELVYSVQGRPLLFVCGVKQVRLSLVNLASVDGAQDFLL